MGMRAPKEISSQENFHLGPSKGVRALRHGRFLKGRVRVPCCTDKCGAADKLPQWDLINLLRESQSRRADKQQAPHHMLKFGCPRTSSAAKMECAHYSLSATDYNKNSRRNRKSKYLRALKSKE